MARGKYGRNQTNNYRRDDVIRGARRYAEEQGQTAQQFWGGLRRSGGTAYDENGRATYERDATWRWRGRRGARARAREQRILNAQAQPKQSEITNSP